MTTWIILGIIYAVCAIPAWFMTRLIMPLFPIYLLITYFNNYEQRNNDEEGR